MNLWRKTAIAILRLLMASVLVLSLTSCGEKAVSQEPYGSLPEKAQLSKQISEVSPPPTIQELRPALEIYQPQVTIVTPKPDEILQDNTVTVRFQVKDLPIFKDPELDLGPHLHVIVDNEPYIAVYDLNQPLALPDLSPGTHTLRVFASRPWHESFKNEGAYAQSTFHILTKTDDNNPGPTKPLLTYSRPKGSYGAEPILLDFYLTNAPLHLVAKDNPTDDITDWRIRCTINGESFVLDRWQAVYLKGFKPGKNWVQLEFLDEQGNPVKNVFNSTVRLISYEPKGKDTLSKIVRGELSADQVRRIVDPNYTAKVPTAEPTPTPTLTPTVEKTPQTQLKEEKQPIPEPEPTPTPTSTPSVEKTPQTQPQTEKQSSPATESQQPPQTQPEKPKSGGYFNRRAGKISTPQTTAEPTPGLTPTLPDIIETPQPETTAEPKPEVTPEAETTLPQKIAPDPEKPELGRYFNRRQYLDAAPSHTLPQTPPNVIEPPSPLETLEKATIPEHSTGETKDQND
ncbi:hypothetical protein [Mastigocladopsis repens]|uniref:hypothetical protein n=1 Tax=Mastigocladopsis repens TaxID=221287 RepID=UPI0003645550|nr:hypothetical protein [Mastigocladopsis repens]